jgi:hypothetical protein
MRVVRRRKVEEMFTEILARIDRNGDAIRESGDETRLYIRESGLRFERFMQQMDRRMAHLEDESRESRARIEAQTRAIWALLDRWGYGPDNPPPEPA